MNGKLLMFVPILIVGIFMAGCSQPLATGIVQNTQNLQDPGVQLVEVNNAFYIHSAYPGSGRKLLNIGDCVTCYSYEGDLSSRCEATTGCKLDTESKTGDAICKEKYNLTFDKLVGDTLYCKNPPAQKEEVYDGIRVILPS